MTPVVRAVRAGTAAPAARTRQDRDPGRRRRELRVLVAEVGGVDGLDRGRTAASASALSTYAAIDVGEAIGPANRTTASSRSGRGVASSTSATSTARLGGKVRLRLTGEQPQRRQRRLAQRHLGQSSSSPSAYASRRVGVTANAVPLRACTTRRRPAAATWPVSPGRRHAPGETVALVRGAGSFSTAMMKSSPCSVTPAPRRCRRPPRRSAPHHHRVVAQILHQRDGQPDHHEHERQRGDDRDRLQAGEGVLAADQQHDGRHRTRRDAPEHDGRRDGSIVPRSDSEPITMEAASAPETKKIATSTITSTLATVGERDTGRAALNSCALGLPSPARSTPACWTLIAAPPKIAEPDQRHHAGHQQHAGDELADGAAAGDPGDEHADERRPRQPPRPVEDRPATAARCRRRRPRRRCAPTSSARS